MMKYMLLVTAVMGLLGLGILTPKGEEIVSHERPFVVRVPEDFPTIQQAVDAVAEGGTVLISPGTYQEIQIAKSIRLIGAGQELVQIQPTDHRSVTIDIEAERPLQVYLADLTLENLGFLDSRGIRIKGDVQAMIERVTVTRYEEGIVLQNLSSVLSAVRVSRNQTGITVTEGNTLIQNSIITDNKREGIAAWLLTLRQSSILVERSLFSGNLGPALLLIGGIFGGPVATLAENTIVKNLGGVYLGYDRDYNFNQLLFTRFHQPEPGPRIITMYKNQIAGNLIYGVALLGQKCPEASYDPDLALLAVSLGGTAFIGMDNEIKDNGKGDLCPPDYPWPPGFRK